MPYDHKALAYPRAVEPYFDLIQVWRREPLDDATRAWLSGQCRHLYLKNGAAQFDSRLRQRVDMKGLSEAGLTWLIAQKDAFLNRLEIALDLHFDDEDARDSTFEFFHRHLVRRHLRRTQEVRCYRGDGQTPCREYHPSLAQTRYDASRSAPNRIVNYKQESSRITGEVTSLLHLEWRVNGVRTLGRLGIESVVDLGKFDHRRFWAHRLRLVDISSERLGLIIRNRKDGTKSRVATSRDKWDGRTFLKYCDGSIHELLRKFGKKNPIRRALTRIPNERWLPEPTKPSL
jgi:hypothetical protein